jgi:hypothetical protein
MVASGSTAFAATPAVQTQQAQKPPTSGVSGPQAKPAIEPGTQDAKQMEKLGPTNFVQTDMNGLYKSSASSALPMVGAVSNVDFQAPSNYCYKNLVYTTVKNSTATAKSIHVRLFNATGYRDIFTSVPANSVASPAFYGVEGNYTAYLYVWNGTSAYVPDESLVNKNVCSVSVTRVYNTGGWAQLKIQNTGTAYASQRSTELAPYPATGTYTGNHYDYPVAGGAAIYRWFSVGTSPYAIVSDTLNSTTSPYYFTGDL